MVINQAYLFVIFAINGIFIGLLFDFFRILRKSFKTANFITYVEDIIFWIITGLSIIFSMYKFSGGSLRLFMFIGLALGITIYMLTLSRFIIKVFVSIIKAISSIIRKIFNVIITILKFIYKIIIKPVHFLFIQSRSFFEKTTKNIKIKSKNIKKLEKNIKTS